MTKHKKKLSTKYSTSKKLTFKTEEKNKKFPDKQKTGFLASKTAL